jgi:predicted Zn-dependent peptidase
MSSDIKTHTFANGFKVVYQKSDQKIPLTNIAVFCNVGSAYEVDGIRGASHFVEHMCFKGTHMTKAKELLMQYNKIGAYFNAYTEKRYTAYIINCDDAHASICLNNLADMLLHSAFSKKEFAKEQHVVVEENIRVQDDNQTVLETELEKWYFSGSSYAHPIDSIEYHPSATYLKYDDIYKWYKTFYHPSNMLCSIVSTLPFSQIISMMKKTDFIEKTPIIANEIGLPYPERMLTPASCAYVFLKKKISATIINLGFRICGYTSHDKYVIKVLKHILNGFSGRLFTAFRTTHGLTYRSSCVTLHHEHAGYISIHLQTDPRKLMRDGARVGVIPILFRLIADLQKHGVTAEEVHNAKGNSKGADLISMQSTDHMAEYNGVEAILNESESIVPYGTLYDNYIAPITKADVNRMIKKYIRKDNMIFGMIDEKGISRTMVEKMIGGLQ